MDFRLTKRDIKTLIDHLRYRWLLAAQTQILSNYPSLKKTSERLKLLVANGYLRYFIRPRINRGRPQHIYSLDKNGSQVVADFIQEPINNLNWENNTKTWGNIDHKILTNDFRLSLETECLNRGFNCKFIPEYKLIKGKGKWLTSYLKETVIDGSEKIGLIPDGVFAMGKNGQNKKVLFMCEIDRSTVIVESERYRDFKSKIKAYGLYMDSNLYNRYNFDFDADFTNKGFRVLIITTTEKRLQNLKQACIREGAFFWLTTFDKISPETILTPIWEFARPDDNNLYSIANSKDIIKRGKTKP